MKLPDNELRYVIFAMVLLAGLALYTNLSHASAGAPPSDMQCEDKSVAGASNLVQHLCTFPPHISKYVNPLVDVPNYSAILYSIPPPNPKPLPLMATLLGWGAGNWGDNPSGSAGGAYYVIVSDYDYARLDVADGPVIGATMPQDWGIALVTGDPARPCSKRYCEALAHRLSAMFHEAQTSLGDLIDTGAGIRLVGNSYGGTAALMIPLILPDEYYRKQITVVDSYGMGNLFVRKADGMNEFGTQPKMGYYWRDPDIQKSWGDFDVSRVDLTLPANQKKVRGVYYHLESGTNDFLGFSLDFFRDVCDKGKIACFGFWYVSNHEGLESGVIWDSYKSYSGPDMSARLDSMLPVFTRSTANFWGERGYYNLGLEWKNAGFVDTATRAEIPIRYRRYTGMGLIADQPIEATFDLTVRRFQQFRVAIGDRVAWRIGSQSGIAIADVRGEITIQNITLQSGETYQPVVLTRG